VNRSNERQEHLRNLVWFCFTLVLPNKRNELLNQLRKKEMWLRLVNNLLLCCLSPNDCHPSSYHIDGFITLNILHPSIAQCVEVTMFFVMCCVNFLCLSCALLRRIFSWSSRHCLLTWQNDFKNIYAMNIVIKFVNIYIYIVLYIYKIQRRSRYGTSDMVKMIILAYT
jgi:hypothetical protein